MSYYSYSRNVTELHRCADAARYDVGTYARAIVKGRAWSATKRAESQAAFIAKRDLIGLPMSGPKGKLP